MAMSQPDFVSVVGREVERGGDGPKARSDAGKKRDMDGTDKSRRWWRGEKERDRAGDRE